MDTAYDSNNNFKIIIITQGLSRIVKPIVNSKHEVVGIIESAPRGYSKNFKLVNILFFINRVIDFVFRHKNETLKSYCLQREIPYYFMLNSDDAKLEEWIKLKHPDIMVVCGMSQLLKKNIYSLPLKGTINLHPSYLPSYRGPNPDFWHYVDLEMNPGVTIHYIDEKEDTGDIIIQKRVPIELGILSSERLDILIGQVGNQLILESLDLILENRAERIKQPLKSPTKRARNIASHEHTKIINWEKWTVDHIWHVLRGTNTWLNALPPSDGLWKGQKWEILNYEKGSNHTQPISTIGKINGKFFVSTKDGIIFIKRRFSIKKFILCILNA